jgi:hypothetical protein
MTLPAGGRSSAPHSPVGQHCDGGGEGIGCFDLDECLLIALLQTACACRPVSIACQMASGCRGDGRGRGLYCKVARCHPNPSYDLLGRSIEVESHVSRPGCEPH